MLSYEPCVAALLAGLLSASEDDKARKACGDVLSSLGDATLHHSAVSAALTPVLSGDDMPRICSVLQMARKCLTSSSSTVGRFPEWLALALPPLLSVTSPVAAEAWALLQALCQHYGAMALSHPILAAGFWAALASLDKSTSRALEVLKRIKGDDIASLPVLSGLLFLLSRAATSPDVAGQAMRLLGKAGPTVTALPCVHVAVHAALTGPPQQHLQSGACDFLQEAGPEFVRLRSGGIDWPADLAAVLALPPAGEADVVMQGVAASLLVDALGLKAFAYPPVNSWCQAGLNGRSYVRHNVAAAVLCSLGPNMMQLSWVVDWLCAQGLEPAKLNASAVSMVRALGVSIFANGALVGRFMVPWLMEEMTKWVHQLPVRGGTLPPSFFSPMGWAVLCEAGAVCVDVEKEKLEVFLSSGVHAQDISVELARSVLTLQVQVPFYLNDFLAS